MRIKPFCLPVLSLCCLPTFALNSTQQTIVNSVIKNQPKQMALLKETVNINSGTHNLKGIKKVADTYIPHLTKLGFATKWVEVPKKLGRAGHLFAYKKAKNNTNKILLIGHLDTVFEANHPFQRYSQKGNYAYGPGVSDMKGGNSVMLFALKALSDNHLLENTNITIALIGDEEDAGLPHKTARKALIDAGKKSNIALGFESAHDLHHIATARRGIIEWHLSVDARSGHSSLIFTPQFKEGAILAISELLTKMMRLSRTIADLSFNPALIAGGAKLELSKEPLKITATNKTNIIAEQAYSQGEIRFLFERDPKQLNRLMQKELLKLHSPIKASFKLDTDKMMPAMEPSKRNNDLFNILSKINESLNLNTLQPHNPRLRGGADISYIAKYVAGLDGLGAVGGNEHAAEEFIDIEKTNKATQRAALLIYQLAHATAISK